MPSRKKTKPHKPPTPAGGVTVACWEDDPGDPKSQPALAPIQVPVPNQAAKPLPFKIGGTVPRLTFISRGRANFCSMQMLARYAGRPIFGAASCRLEHLGKLVILCR